MHRKFAWNSLLKHEMNINIHSGPIDTPMVQKSKETAPKENGPATIPMGREGKASEVAELICFLLCDGSTYITGTTQSIDGGWGNCHI